MNTEILTTNHTNFCHPAPTDKRTYISDIGKLLVKDYGKKRYYKPKQVKEVHKRSSWADNVDFSCWAMSVFSSRGDFDRHHEAIGEVCSYPEMKSTMLEGISLNEVTPLPSFPTENLDASWLDLGDTFDGIFEGIGEFFSGIISSIDF